MQGTGFDRETLAIRSGASKHPRVVIVHRLSEIQQLRSGDKAPARQASTVHQSGRAAGHAVLQLAGGEFRRCRLPLAMQDEAPAATAMAANRGGRENIGFGPALTALCLLSLPITTKPGYPAPAAVGGHV